MRRSSIPTSKSPIDTYVDHLQLSFVSCLKGVKPDAQNNIRRKKFDLWLRDYENRAAAHRNSQLVIPSPTSPNVWPYIRHRLTFFNEGIMLYTQHKYARMAFDRYSRSQSAMDTIVTQLTKREPTLFLIGGAEFSSNSPIKGYVRCPGIRKLVVALKKYHVHDHILVDEFHTSQHCGLCLSHFDNSTKRDRFKRCRLCQPLDILQPAPKIVTKKASRIYHQQVREAKSAGNVMLVPKNIKFHITDETLFQSRTTTWHRDICACRLIRYKGISALFNNVIHPNLQRINVDDDDEQHDQKILRF